MNDKTTTIRVNNTTKDLLKSLGGKDESYNDILQKLLINYEVADEDVKEMISTINSPIKRVFFWFGVLVDSVFPNYTETKYYEKIQQLSEENFRKLFPRIVNEDYENESQHADIVNLINHELIQAKDNFNISTDDMRLYFGYGVTMSNYF